MTFLLQSHTDLGSVPADPFSGRVTLGKWKASVSSSVKWDGWRGSASQRAPRWASPGLLNIRRRGPRCSPGNLGQGDELARGGGGVEAVGSGGLHGDDGHVPPAHLLQPLDHSAQQAPATHRQRDGPRLCTQRLLQFFHDGSVAFPGELGTGVGVGGGSGLGSLETPQGLGAILETLVLNPGG